MSLVTLKMKNDDWDNVKFIIDGDCPTIITITNRHEVESLHYTLSLYSFEHPTESLFVTINNCDYLFEVNVWMEMMFLLDNWFFEDFAPVEYEGEFEPEVRDLTDSGSDTSAQIIEFAHYQ